MGPDVGYRSKDELNVVMIFLAHWLDVGETVSP